MNLKKLGLLGIIAWLYFPTGTPDDLIISLPLISYLKELYIPIGLLILAAVWIKTR